MICIQYNISYKYISVFVYMWYICTYIQLYISMCKVLRSHVNMYIRTSHSYTSSWKLQWTTALTLKMGTSKSSFHKNHCSKKTHADFEKRTSTSCSVHSVPRSATKKEPSQANGLLAPHHPICSYRLAEANYNVPPAAQKLSGDFPQSWATEQHKIHHPMSHLLCWRYPPCFETMHFLTMKNLTAR